MINEAQVALLWQRLFAEQLITPESLNRADQLIEELRAESPLRFRLEQELREIRQMQTAKSQPAKAPRRKLSKQQN